MISEVAAGVVTYNPDIKKLKNLISKLSHQTERIFIVDNASDNLEEIRALRDEKQGSSCSIGLIENDSNRGIATALNQIMAAADADDFNWVLLLDDDSNPDEDLIDQLYEGTSFKDIGIVCPRIYDINSGKFLTNKGEKRDKLKKKYQMLESCITSGSLVSLDAWFAVGGYDEYLFMDFVDFDFCIRLEKEHYRIIQKNSLTMEHELGKSEERRLLVKKVDVMNHSAERKYYITRNRIYCEYKYNNRFGLRNAAGVVKAILLVICFESDKGSKVKAILKGVRDGSKEGRKQKAVNKSRAVRKSKTDRKAELSK